MHRVVKQDAPVIKNNHTVGSDSKYQNINIDQLKPGMYVTSISFKNKKVNIKSEGYILSQTNIDRLIKKGIARVVVDPSREKKPNKTGSSKTNNQSSPSITPQSESPLNEVTREKTQISLDQEMNKAKKLYNNAKDLQQKVISSLKAGKTIAIDDAQEITDAMVDSIFRNQDALSCISRLKNKDTYLIEHSLNCSILMAIFAKHLGLKRNIIQELALGAFLHDIGKVFIPDDILNKKGKLNDKEHNIIKSHVALGLKILEDTPQVSHIAISMVAEHHERVDGSGYPKKLTDNAISKYGKMMAIVDSYDAMTTERIFRGSVHPINAFKTLVAESPSSYDQGLVEKFIQCLGVYPVGTLVKLTSGKLGIISKINPNKPLQPFVRVFYNIRLNQSIALEELDLSKPKYKDQIDRCIKPEEFNINLVGFFKTAFIA